MLDRASARTYPTLYQTNPGFNVCRDVSGQLLLIPGPNWTINHTIAMSSPAHEAASAAIEKQFGVTRSPLWEETRKQYLAKKPKCAVCGDTGNVEVHHKFPFHYVVIFGRPDLELDERNFVTLCEETIHDHHLLIGHLDDWKSYDPPAQPDQLDAFEARFKNQTAATIKADAAFRQAHAGKPSHLDKMTLSQKTTFKQLLDTQLPPNAAIVEKAKKARAGM